MSIKTYAITLPLGPTINNYYGSSGNRRFIKPAGVAFRQEVALAVRMAKMPCLTGRVWMSVRVFPRDKRMQDISNRIKALEDALQHAGAFVNDEQIDHIEVDRDRIVPGGRCEVLIGELP